MATFTPLGQLSWVAAANSVSMPCQRDSAPKKIAYGEATVTVPPAPGSNSSVLAPFGITKLGTLLPVSPAAHVASYGVTPINVLANSNYNDSPKRTKST